MRSVLLLLLLTAVLAHSSSSDGEECQWANEMGDIDCVTKLLKRMVNVAADAVDKASKVRLEIETKVDDLEARHGVLAKVFSYVVWAINAEDRTKVEEWLENMMAIVSEAKKISTEADRKYEDMVETADVEVERGRKHAVTLERLHDILIDAACGGDKKTCCEGEKKKMHCNKEIEWKSTSNVIEPFTRGQKDKITLNKTNHSLVKMVSEVSTNYVVSAAIHPGMIRSLEFLHDDNTTKDVEINATDLLNSFAPNIGNITQLERELNDMQEKLPEDNNFGVLERNLNSFFEKILSEKRDATA